MSIKFENFHIIEVSKDKIGRYMKLIVQLPDESLTIRWELDSFTYQQIKKIVSKNYFDSLATDYRFEMLPYYGISQHKKEGGSTFVASIRCIQGERAKRIDFTCSERFAGNLEWLNQEVQTVDELFHLKWENWLL